MPRTRAQARGADAAAAPAAPAAAETAAVPAAETAAVPAAQERRGRRTRTEDLDLEVCVIIE